MKPFLEYVAEDILAKYGTDLSRLVVVFPNKRAALFLNEHLVRLAGKPIWSPSYVTISELFRRHGQRQVADPIRLVCELHRSFTAQTGIDESLDHFYGWGQLLLDDFDDIDKQMADADRVLANMTDLHEMDDDSYLTDEQRQVLRRFFLNFSEEHTSELRQRFLKLWSRMADIYHDFNRRLESQQIAYEGALYREVVESVGDDTFSDTQCFLFVGFNVLLKVEQQLFTLLRRQQRARFYWDFDDYYLKDNEAGHFIAQYLESFPNELDPHDADIYHHLGEPKRIAFASAKSEDIQARYAATWLRADQHRIDDGHRTAIVMCNEGLLPTIIHCLPQEVESVNITTGYPLAQSPAASLITQLIALRRDGYDRQRGLYRLRQVRSVLRHPYVVGASPQAVALLRQLTEEHNYYPSQEQLSVDALTTMLFRPFAPLYQNEELLIWLCDVTQAIATTSAQDRHAPLKEEMLFRTFTLLNRLLNLSQDGGLQTDIVTLGRLVTQLMQQTTVPFHGEPVEGLQIMGLLETRNLDFDHLLILSAQEGNLPRGASDTSFIPYSLRRAYGLTTPEHKVALYSYYFHRLIQRANDITIVYNNATTDGQKGEMSRFLLQLMVEYPHPVDYLTLQGSLSYQPLRPQPVENHAQLPSLLAPTAINRYLRCPLQFHYYYVCGLREPDETDDDTIDNRIFGNIFHEAARAVYARMMKADGRITRDDIDGMLKHGADIERAVDEAFRTELFHLKEESAAVRKHIAHLNGLQIINRQVIIHYLRQLLKLDRELAPFRILTVEGDVSMELDVKPGMKAVIGGRIDRMDMVSSADGQQYIRVIDYKTGAYRMKALPDVEAVFSQEGLKDHSDYYLQAMLYSVIVAHEHPETPVAPALLFIQHAGAEGYDPVLQFGREPISDITVHEARFLELLRETVARMFDPAVPLTPTSDEQRCRTCPFRQLCF